MGFGLTALDGLTRFNSLVGLSIAGMYHTGSQPNRQDTISDFSALARLPALADLTVHDCRFFDDTALSHVASIPNLREFSLSSFMNTVSNISVLSRIDGLRRLDVSGYAKWHFKRSFWRNLLRGYHCELDRQIQELKNLLPECEFVTSGTA